MVTTTNNYVNGVFHKYAVPVCNLPELAPPTHQVSNVGIVGSASAVVVRQPKAKLMLMDVSASAVDNYLGYELITLQA